MKNLVEKTDAAFDWKGLPDLAQWTIEHAVQIQQIPAPTFHEEARADYISEQFKALSLIEISIDDSCNVIGRLPGKRQDVAGLMISAHTDTVFADDTDLRTREEEGLIYGPGLGDNSIGVAGMLALALMFKQQQLVPDCDLWFVATSREEGLGDLQGMKAVFQKLQNRVGAVINLEGLAFGHVYHAGIAVRRLCITAATEGGHSWLHFGRRSAIHGLMELGARIAAIRAPTTPRTTYNMGMIEGGTSINSIASRASLWLDLRSENRDTLAALEREVRSDIEAVQQPDLAFSVEVVGDRPAGYLDPEHPLIQGALAALALVGTQGALETGSTDGNVPLAAGCPAVTIGITRGGNAHRVDEYIETKPVEGGLRQLITLALAAAAYLST